MRKKLHTLAAYSLAAGAYLCIPGQADGQAVYTDIDPDIVLDDNFEFAVIDIDNDGVNDFGFIAFSFITTTDHFSSQLHVVDIYAGPYLANGRNFMAATTTHYVTADSSVITIFNASAFEAGAFIDDSKQFYSYQLQRLGFRAVNELGGDWSGGHWFPSLTDHYLGVRFLDTLDCLHYGWIRCDVLDSAKVIIVKDFAYELKCDTPIKAGDMVGDTTVAIHNLQSTAASIYAFNKSIYIHLSQLPEPNTQVLVYDMLGREIYRQDLETTSTQLQLNTAAGIYLVTIQNGEDTFSKKVVIE